MPTELDALRERNRQLVAAANREVLAALNTVLKEHHYLWQDVLPLLAEYAEEHCVEEPDPDWVRRYEDGARLLREAAVAFRR